VEPVQQSFPQGERQLAGVGVAPLLIQLLLGGPPVPPLGPAIVVIPELVGLVVAIGVLAGGEQPAQAGSGACLVLVFIPVAQGQSRHPVVRSGLQGAIKRRQLARLTHRGPTRGHAPAPRRPGRTPRRREARETTCGWRFPCPPPEG